MKKIMILTLLILFFLSGCINNNNEEDEERYGSRTFWFFEVFGDISCRVSIIDYEHNLLEKEETIKTDIEAMFIKLDKAYSVTRDDTLLSKINKQAGKEPVEVTEEVIYIIKEAIRVSQMSIVDEVALYDITIFPVWKHWDFIDNMQKTVTIPTKEELDELLTLVDYRNIEIDEDNLTVFLKEEGMQIDLGSIVKGYAGDKVKEYLLENGISKAVIDVGGHITVVGTNYNFTDKVDRPWKVMIRTPYIPTYMSEINHIGYFDESIGVSVDTAGIYERYVISNVDSKEYHHILDPRTGFSRQSGLYSATIITDTAIIADALSTAVFNLGIEKGSELVELLAGFEVVFITLDKEIFVSSGLENRFNFNEKIEDLGYSYQGVYNAINN